MKKKQKKKVKISTIVKSEFFLLAAIIILCSTAKDERAIEIASRGEITMGKIVGVTRISEFNGRISHCRVEYDCFYYVNGIRYETHFTTKYDLVLSEGQPVSVRYLTDRPGESMVFNEDNLPTFKKEIAKYRAAHSLLRSKNCRFRGRKYDLTRLRKIAAREIKMKK